MEYKSTRSTMSTGVSSAFAIKTGIAADGGLFMPENIPTLTISEVEALASATYSQRAVAILSKFLTDYTVDELEADCTAAYSEEKFRGGAAPLAYLRDGVRVLELWHGPTAAFKDMALQIMPRLLSRALKKTGEDRTALILVATSGDTGKAALEGYKDVPHTAIKVFYPVDGVSPVQKMQMASQEGENVSVTAIRGNFDDAQTGVKRIFAEPAMASILNERGYFLSSANSINWGRLVPQIVYYVSSYCDLLKSGDIAPGDKIDVCVPTGNFGNIFAAYIAKQMGLPIDKLICASNENNVLTDFFTTGTYDRNRLFHTTMSPSMDILISSNLERLLYLICGAEKTKFYMAELSKKGTYTISAEELAEIRKNFVAYHASEDDTAAMIKETFNGENYLIDTHTAVAFAAAKAYRKENGSDKKILIASTASPYKFAGDVLWSLGKEKPENPFTSAAILSGYTKTDVHYALADIATRKVRFTETVNPADMADTVIAFADSL